MKLIIGYLLLLISMYYYVSGLVLVIRCFSSSVDIMHIVFSFTVAVILHIISLKLLNKKDLDDSLKNILDISFPNGDEQINYEAGQLRLALHEKTSFERSKSLLVWTKSLLIISEDKSPQRMTQAIIDHEKGNLNFEEAATALKCIIDFPTKLYVGGDGTFDDMVKINSNDSAEGVDYEYTWLEMNFGKKDVLWSLSSQLSGIREDGIDYDQLNIILSTGELVSVFFDITSFYGKISDEALNRLTN